jgi:hypothetical protein
MDARGGGVYQVRVFDSSYQVLSNAVTTNDLETEVEVSGVLNTFNLSPKSLALFYHMEHQVMTVYVLDEKDGSPKYLFSSDYVIDNELMEIWYKTFEENVDYEELLEDFEEFLFVINSNGSPVIFQINGEDPRIIARKQRVRKIIENLKQNHELDPK